MKTQDQQIREAAMRLYQIYPKHVGRAAALKAIGKAMAREQFEMLLEATTAYAEARIGQDHQFTPHPATWFNQERYHDDRSCWTNGKAAAHGQASEAYDVLCCEVRRVGALQVPSYPDQASRAAVKLMGGWTTFCGWQTDQLEWRRKQFLAAYGSGG